MIIKDMPVTNVVITFGPTDEGIDDVMKITNMSTGRLGVELAEALVAKYGNSIKLWMLGNKTAYRINSSAMRRLEARGVIYEVIGGLKNGEYVSKETADLLLVLKKVMSENQIDYVFHPAAVGDYTGRFATNNKLLAEEIYELYLSMGTEFSEAAIAELLVSPNKVFNADTKMSSDEPNMIVGLELTPKVIASINSFAEQAGYKTRLLSWKLLSDVPPEELYNVALKHGQRNHSWRVIANDLSRIGDNAHWAMIIDVADGSTYEVNTKGEIADYLTAITLPAPLAEMQARCGEIHFTFTEDVSFKYLEDDQGQVIGVLGVEGDKVMLHLLKQFQGQGLGREAVQLCLDQGWSLYADANWGNKSAFEKYGLSVKGISEQHGCEIMA